MIVKWIKKFRRWFYTLYAYLRSGNKQVFTCRINGLVRFNGKETFSNNVNFNGCHVYGRGKVHFGANFHSAKGLIFLTTFHNHKGEKIPYDHTSIVKNVAIGDNVWLGMNVTVMGGITIGEGAIVQAGSVVVNNIPDCAIAGGHPAKVFSYRDKTKYADLKQRKQFL